MMSAKIRTLIVDDSAIVRKILSERLAKEPDIEVVGTAPDPFIARDKILALRPDVLTLDIEMPRMSGLEFLKRLMDQHPLPVIMISSLAQNSCNIVMEALRIGAVEVLAKPGGPYSVGNLCDDLPQKIRAAAAAKVRKASAIAARPRTSVLNSRAPFVGSNSSVFIAIGASTGGTEAIREVLESLPGNMPGIVITQHIPAGFSRAFADRMNSVCSLDVKEAEDGDVIREGLALIAPGNFHMTVETSGLKKVTRIKTGPKVCYQRPAVDVMFSSMAAEIGAGVVGVLLTGMGSDGAEGLLKIRNAGGHTIVQDEATCVVFGMPREAIRVGAAKQVLPLQEIGPAIEQAVAEMQYQHAMK